MTESSKKLFTVLFCIGLIFIAEQFKVFNSLNGFFNSRFQSYALNKQNEFAVIIVEQNAQQAPTYAQWRQVLEQMGEWTDADIYLLDLNATASSPESVTNSLDAFNQLLQKPNLHLVQSTQLDEDFNTIANPLPQEVATDNLFSINYPDFSSGEIRNYIKSEDLYPDIIEKIYREQEQILASPLAINYMIGSSYLPSVNFDDVLNDRVDARLFEGRSVLITNQANQPVPTVLSHRRQVTQSQYYGYLFETALQNLALKIPTRVVVIALLLFLGLLIVIINSSLANRYRMPVSLLLAMAVIVLSFVTLGSALVYLPVIEMLLSIFIPFYLLQQQDTAHDKEQLALGSRLYDQILESSGKAQQQHSTEELLTSFSRFFCELVGAQSIHFILSKQNKEIVHTFNGTDFMRDTKLEVDTSGRTAFEYSISLGHDQHATIAINEYKPDFNFEITKNLLAAKEAYIKVLLAYSELDRTTDKNKILLWKSSGYTKQHERFKLTTDRFLSHYHLLKNHFESLQTASVLYGVNGEIIQSNQSAERFIRDNDLKLFNQNLIASLIQLTELDQNTIANALLDLVDDQDSVIIWPTRIQGLDKNYLLTLSAYTHENVRLGGYLIELFDIEEVNYIASLKNNFLSEMNNDLRNDFSEVILALDFLAMGVEGGLSLEEVNAKVAEFSEKLQPSEMLMRSTNEIMREKSYPVDIRALVSQGIKAASEQIEEKQIHVDIKQPRFINLVMVNYQHFAQICKQLLLFAVQDCMDEGKLSLVIQEIEQDQTRFISFVITTKGYGIFDRERVAQDAQQDISSISELQAIDKYIHSLGGRLELESSVGQGSRISTLLPCFRF